MRILFSTLVFVVAASAATHAQNAVDWRAEYLRDLDSLRVAIQSNHPGAIDTANPEFARTLDRAYAEARELAPRINDLGSFRLGLTRFINQFEDEHLQIGFEQQVDSLTDAGVIVAFRNGDFFVQALDSLRYPDAPQLKGAKLLSCDGSPARQVFTDRVLWWRGRPRIEADWARYAPLFFVDYGPPTPPAPRSCVFDAAGRRVTRNLKWLARPRDAVNADLQRAFPTVTRTVGTERFGERKLWYRIPTFAINAEPQLSVMKAALDSLRAFTRDDNWDLIVFDLRGNRGGSSHWSDEIARIVFGEEWARQAAAYLFDGVYTEWRLSPDNIKSLRGIQQQIEKRDGADSQNAQGFRTFVDSAEAQLKRGVRYFGTPQARSGAPLPSRTKVPGKVVVIGTSSCFSACLDFLDRMRLHGATVQVGETTGVDTNYMENWGGPISKLTRWGHPLKVYRNRRRANNEAYPPHVRYEGALEDDVALKRWVLENYSRW